MTTSGIYAIRNKKTGHCYIGSSVDVRNRKYQHFFALRRGTHSAAYLQRSWNKYGEEAFEFVVLEEVPDVTRLVEREQYWLDTQCPKYNSRKKAESNYGLEVSEEARVKLREFNLRPEVIAKKKAELTGHEVAPETVELIKAARAKQKITEGMLQALADGRAKLTPEQRKLNRLGMTNSDEHNRKIAEAHTGMTHKPESLIKMRNAKLGTTQSEELVTRRIQASWGSKTDEEKADIIAKRKATIEAKRNQSS